MIIVLGLLSILLVLATLFIHAMISQRITVHDYAGDVRARNLVQVGMVRTMENVDRSMIGVCYPWWKTNGPAFAADALSSGASPVASNRCEDILSGEASNMIPRALWGDATNAAARCYWTNITSFDDSVTARIAYLAVNCSGLLDANMVGGTNRTHSTNVHELSLRHVPEVGADEPIFYANRAQDVRYETIAELAGMDNIVVSNLFIHSYDQGRDVYFTNVNDLGSENIGLLPKLDVNNTTASNYWERLTNALAQAGYGSNSDVIAWNTINYIDSDRVPQNGNAQPWLDDTVCEDVPLINEVVLRKTDATNLLYKFSVELWYPFVPNRITLADGFSLRIDLYRQSTNMTPSSYEYAITNMEFGKPNAEFLVLETPDFNINAGGTNVPVSATNPVWFLAQVLLSDGPVDQAMDGLPFRFTATRNYSVNDPRCNGHSNWWTSASETLGRKNTICDPWANEGQGLPIHHANKPMKNIGEIGYIFSAEPWQDIQLVDYRPTQNFALPDLLTVRSANTPTRGLVNISSRHKEVLEALFYRMEIGYSNAFTNITVKITALQSNQIWCAIDGPFVTFRDLFDSVATNSNYSGWNPGTYVGVPANTNACNDLKEDAFRNILEMVTFRQNIFTVIVAAQVFAPAGAEVIAEKRAVAVIYRDAYTGKSFTRFFKWLED